MKVNIHHTNRTDNIVYQTIKGHPGITRTGIVKKTGIARTTVFDSATRMIRKEIIRKESEIRTKPGRPKTFYY